MIHQVSSDRRAGPRDAVCTLLLTSASHQCVTLPTNGRLLYRPVLDRRLHYTAVLSLDRRAELSVMPDNGQMATAS